MKRILIMIAVIAVIIIVGSVVFVASSSRETERVDGSKIIAATRAYTADLKAKGVSIPRSVPLQELIDRRLLTPSDVSGFTGMEVTVSLSADESHPQEIVIRARLANGQEIGVMGDGSVQQLSLNRARQ